MSSRAVRQSGAPVTATASITVRPAWCGQEVEALGGHQAQRPAGPYQRREDGGQVAGLAGAGDAGRAGDGAVAELAEAVQPGCERPGQRCLQGGAGPVPVREHVSRAGLAAADGPVGGEPGGDFRVGAAGPAVEHDVGDGGAEGRHGRELPEVAVHRAGQLASAVAWFLRCGGAWPGGELAQDRGGRGREPGLTVDGGGGCAGDCVDVVQLLPQGGGLGGPSP